MLVTKPFKPLQGLKRIKLAICGLGTSHKALQTLTGIETNADQIRV
jgi:hypothetical protein